MVSSAPSSKESDFLILALDLGSSSVRAALYDSDGRAIDVAHSRQPVDQNDDGTFDPAQIRRATERAIDRCLDRLRESQEARPIAAVGTAGAAMTWVGVDGSGEAVTPVFSYADARSAPFAEQLISELRNEGNLGAIYQDTGVPIHTAYAPAQFLRLKQEEPELLKRVRCWQTTYSFLLGLWRDQPCQPISSSEAGWTGLFDRQSRSWHRALCRRLGLDPAQLPPIQDYSRSVAGLSPSFEERWPELADSRFFLAVGDGAAANVGSGCDSPDRVAVTIGTTGAMRMIVPVGERPPRVPAGLWCYPVDRSGWLLGGALTDGGSLYAWMTESLAVEDEASLLQLAADIEPDGHGLTLLPFLRGERAPGWATGARLTISGITPATTPAALVRAGMEAIAYRFRLIADLLDPLDEGEYEVIASGGALHAAPLWREILADVLGRPLHLVDVDEATSRGAAILALKALGANPESDYLPGIESTSRPNPQRTQIYRAAAARQQWLYDRLLKSAPTTRHAPD